MEVLAGGWGWVCYCLTCSCGRWVEVKRGEENMEGGREGGGGGGMRKTGGGREGVGED